MLNPVILIHGYSADETAFEQWQQILCARGYAAELVHVCNYRTLTNEITIKDLAEGFDRALRIQAGLAEDQEFDAIVHSTGMLVLRSWLTTYAGRQRRLKRLIGLAPATFGSYLAHKGRSWLGAIFKGNRQWGPDFLEAGDLVLDALELGSTFTWDLAHQDLVIPDGQAPQKADAIYGVNDQTPYVFTFCGTAGYDGIASLVNEKGTDGTVRWAGCPLNTRKIKIDLTHDAQRVGKRIDISPWYANIDIPLVPIADLNHETLLNQPSDELIDLVLAALQVSSKDDFDRWHVQADVAAKQAKLVNDRQAWQQFVVHVTDERGDPIPDFYVQLLTKERIRGAQSFRAKEISIDAHTYQKDPSYRCFHLNLSDLGWSEQGQIPLENLHLQVIASSGSEYVGYQGYHSEKIGTNPRRLAAGTWDAKLDISPLLNNRKVKLFWPFTTTLIEIRLNREPLPLDRSIPNSLFWFADQKPAQRR